MKAHMIWGSNIDAQLGIANSVVRIHGEHDLSRIGIFAVEVITFNAYKGKTERRYKIEAYELDSEGHPVEIHFEGYRTKAELKKAFKTFQLK